MSLSTTRLPLSHVGAPRGQGPDFAACSHPQVGCLLWRSQSAYRPIRAQDLQGVQRGNVPAVPYAVAAASNARASHHRRAGQRSLSSCRDLSSLPAPACCTLETAVSSTLQSAALAHRAGLETDSASSNAQPLLPCTGRSAQSRECMFQWLASPERNLATTMLHYLGRYV